MDRSKFCVKLPKVIPEVKGYEKNWKSKDIINPRENKRKSIDIKTRDVLASLKSMRIVSLTPTRTPLVSSQSGMNMLQIIDRRSFDSFKKRFRQNIYSKSPFKLESVSRRSPIVQFSFSPHIQKENLIESTKRTKIRKSKRKKHFLIKNSK